MDEQNQETGWLVERYTKEGSQWLELDPEGVYGWTNDPSRALRLARREDAHNACLHFEEGHPEEHAWG